MTGKAPFEHPRYEARGPLGQGSQGAVFRVIDREQPGRPLVAKLLRTASARALLEGEFALLSRLRARGLCRAHDLCRDTRSGAPFFVEDLVEGPDLAEHVARAPLRARSQALSSALVGALQALATLHEAGFVHGDIKPAHVRIGADGPTLLDLGAAVARGARAVGYTPALAAPELVAGANATVAADIYALGASAWVACAGRPPGGDRRSLRDEAPFVAPSLAEAIEAMVAPHPRDRPEGALAALSLLGKRGHDGLAGLSPVGRSAELERLVRGLSRERVRYLAGPPGSGRTTLCREVTTRALLAGREARMLSLGAGAGPWFAGLCEALRGDVSALPFLHRGEGPLLLVLDDVDEAPRELAAALELHRCKPGPPAIVEVLASVARPPPGASCVELAPLADVHLVAIAEALGEREPGRVDELLRVAAGRPGWLLSAMGRVPISEASSRERVGALSAEARRLLFAVVAVGGRAPGRWLGELACEPALAELFTAGLLGRTPSGDEPGFVVPVRGLDAHTLGADDIEALAAALLADERAPAAALLSLSSLASSPLMARLLDEAAARASRVGQTSVALDALARLCDLPAERSVDRLMRLERAARDAGVAAHHTSVLALLDEAGQRSREARLLALRRRAEQRARASDVEGAEELAEQAIELARTLADPVGEAFALATSGLVLLQRSSWRSAQGALERARALLLEHGDRGDIDEAARVDHNLGVVALYRGDVVLAIEAFRRSLAAKTRLSDRAGVRACLRNLGYAEARAGLLDEAEAHLSEAQALAVSLGQIAGRAWCLAAMADVAVRRGDAARALSLSAEAEALGDEVPGAVRADLAMARAEALLLRGDVAGSLTALSQLDPSLRAADALVDARALAIEARARLASTPPERRLSARLAARAVRRSRLAGIAETESLGLAALAEARRAPRPAPPPPVRRDTQIAPPLLSLVASAPAGEAPLRLLEGALSLTRAERALLALFVDGEPPRLWGLDVDRVPLSPEALSAREALLSRASLLPAPEHDRSFAGPDGPGSRLLAPCPSPPEARVALALEHRFSQGRFDALPEGALASLCALASLAARVAAPSEVVHEDAHEAPPPPFATALPPQHTAFATVSLARPSRAFPEIVGKSAPLEAALARLDAAVDASLPVLLEGETGTGKDLFARALHDRGPRARGPFVAVNCAAISDALFEAELFGHARGSFTGADRPRPGLVARADKGTLFLDEVGELPLARQASLLRFLETSRYRPVGGDDEREADVRVVAATNRDLDAAAREGSFRRDLLYRLDVLRVRIPPLRERPSDVPLLLEAFLAREALSAPISPQALAALEAYRWPGNVRELEHLVQRLKAFRVERIDVDHLPRAMRPAAARKGAEDPRSQVETALERAGGNISHAARDLGITRHGLKKRMVRLGLREPSRKPS